MKRVVKILVWLAILAIVAVAAGLGGLYWYVTNNDVKDILSGAMKRATGHDLYIMGEARMTLFPAPTLYASDIRIPAFNGDNPIFTAAELDIAAKWGLPPFIWKGVELTSFKAESPAVFLKENKKGLPNWKSAVRSRKGFAGLASSGGGSSSAPSSGGSNSLESIGIIQMNNVSFTYEGDKSGTNIDLKNMNLTIDGADLAATAITANGQINGQELSAQGLINMQEDTRPLSVALSAAGINAEFSGDSTGVGQLSLSGNNLRGTLSKFVEPAAVSTLPASSFAVKTTLTSEGKTRHLKNLDASLGQAVAFKGDVAYTDRGRRSPLVIANGQFNRLNLDALGICGTSSSSSGGSKGSSSQSTAKANDWDTTPINLSFIRSANWKTDLALNSFTCQGMPVQTVKLNAENDGLTVTLNDFTATLPKNGSLNTQGFIKYGNRITGDLTTTLNNLPVESFMSAPGSLAFPLSGEVKTQLNGASMKDLMSNLKGNVNLSAQNAILPARQLEAISLKLSSILGGARTATVDFNAAYTIDKGIAETQDFSIITKDNFLSILGEGKVDIGHRSMAYKLKPNVKTNGGVFKKGLAIPVSVQGRWHNLKVRPDSTVTKSIGTGVGAAVGGPAGALIGNTIGGVLSGDENAVGNLLKGATNLLENKDKPEEEAPKEEGETDPIQDGVENLLKGLF